MALPVNHPFEFILEWQSSVARHRDRYIANLPEQGKTGFAIELENTLRNLSTEDVFEQDFAPGELVPDYSDQQMINFPTALFECKQRQLNIDPRVGRFYPQAFAWQAFNCTRNHFVPFRLIKHVQQHMAGDANHPLAHYPLTLTVKPDVRNFPSRMPASALPGTPLRQQITDNGPGMQAPYLGIQTDFYSQYPFPRSDERDDRQFYANPRMINHLDNVALTGVRDFHARLLQPGMRVLDLMASCHSHLPDELTDALHITGLGMNRMELQANPRLNEHFIHDLNRTTQLPFADNTFDAVICTVSVEYLTQPLAIMCELARITRTGGTVAMTVSTRWFPGKAIDPWTEMHPFERQGLVLDYFLQSRLFGDLRTESLRGLPRPLNDPHIHQTKLSDPLFHVWGKVQLKP